ncbi:N-acetyltransferase [Rhodovarius crocodyli]|uniref:N-acetyltransferase n=1 Tax=Rhodovarius crocodyli TaxID=1979269 RepID=A0A437M3M6_9PROT|nr:GNAT family N-acetyltransferase [Rhodovarius crocodyli]RVT92196.1 N-acetyltransferase [Rhodovarius crocodyli]
MAKPPHPELQTARLRLRRFRPEDAEGLHQCLADPGTMRFWNTPPHTRPLETERAVLRMMDCTPAYYRFWAVADAQDDRCIGLASYHDGHIRSRRADLGYMIHPAHQRRGLGTEAVGALVGFCFTELRLHRLQLLIHPENTASLALAARLGFRREGLLRGHLRVGEVWHDQCLLARLNDDTMS